MLSAVRHGPHRDVEASYDAGVQRHLRHQRDAQPVGDHLRKRMKARAVEGGVAPRAFKFAGGQRLVAQAVAILQQQQVFDMAGALAWTLQLVFFVLVVQAILTLIESVAFRYRAISERTL